MSWELRVWLPALPPSLSNVDLTTIERRTDHYALGFGADVGVKRRGGHEVLEVKTLERRKRRGCEKWRKTKPDATPDRTWVGCAKCRAKTTLPPPHDGVRVEVADVVFDNGVASKSVAFERGKPKDLYAACAAVFGLGDEWKAADLADALGPRGFVGGYPTALLEFGVDASNDR